MIRIIYIYILLYRAIDFAIAMFFTLRGGDSSW